LSNEIINDKLTGKALVKNPGPKDEACNVEIMISGRVLRKEAGGTAIF
jgi:hypothetical protein